MEISAISYFRTNPRWFGPTCVHSGLTRDEFTLEEVWQSLAEFVSREAWRVFVVVVQGGKIKTMDMKRIIKPGDRG